MPLTVEPFKPRLCHAERFLNLCIRDLLLPLDYISNLPRCVAKNHFQSTMDDKTSYDQLLSPNSTTYFGLDLMAGILFIINTLWLESECKHYYTTGMATTSYVQSLGIPFSQYIDDRHIGHLALLPTRLTQLKNGPI